MRVNKVAWIICIFSIFMLCSQFALAADVAKIGVVDFQKIFITSNAGKAIQAEIKAKREVMEADLKKRGEEIENIGKRLERESMVMSKEMREEKEREYRIKVNDFKAQKDKYQKEAMQFERPLLQKLRKDILAVTSEIGKKEGYLLIIEKPYVVYAPTTSDLTDKIIQRLNKK